MKESDANSANPVAVSPPDLLPTVFDWWSNVLKLPSVGPIYAFSKDFQAYADDFIALGRMISEMKSNLEQYWGFMNEAYGRASRDTFEKSPKQVSSKDEFEQYRRAMIESFEDAFTCLFA